MFLIEDPVTAVRCSYYFARLFSALVDLWVKVRCMRAMTSPRQKQSKPAAKQRRR